MDQRKTLNRELVRMGANIRRERMAREITQEKLAEASELNIRTVQKIEAGRLNIVITTFLRLKRALKASSDELLD